MCICVVEWVGMCGSVADPVITKCSISEIAFAITDNIK